MKLTNIRMWIAASATPLFLFEAPAVAQDVYSNAVADHGMVVLHDSMLRQNLKYARNKQKAARRAGPNPTPRKAEICAERPRYAREYGADHPKFRKLDAMCERDGY